MVRTEEGTDSTRVEMTALLEVLIGANVNENLVVMVDNQSILREISRWVGEGGRTFLALSANPDILRMIINHRTTAHEDYTGDSHVPM